MDRLLKMVQKVAQNHRNSWSVHEKHVEVQLGETSRRQKVHLRLKNGYYFFISVIMGGAAVKKNLKRWNELVLMAWQRNADHELVTFAFDKRDRLVGLIRHPAEYLDPEELEHYIITLTRECDRFEYLLAGQDRF
jgi:uncharacterized protein (DUF1786 family)